MNLTAEDLKAIAILLEPINNRLDKIESRLDNIEEDIELIKEYAEITRVTTNAASEWIEKWSDSDRPYPVE